MFEIRWFKCTGHSMRYTTQRAGDYAGNTSSQEYDGLRYTTDYTMVAFMGGNQVIQIM